MKIRLYNAKIMTMEAGRSIFPGEILIQDDKILSIIDTEGEIPPLTERFDKEIDCKGNLLMPGFKDAHTHSPMTFLRSYADDMELDTWLNTRVFPMEARLDEESIYEFGRLAILEYLTSGITSIFDMYIMPDVMAKVCMDTGMRCCLVSGLNRFTSSIEKLTDEYERWNKADPLIKYHLGFHAEYTTPEPLLKELSEVANHYRAPVYTHMSETAHEVAGCKERYGMTPPVYLDSLGLFEYGGGGYHCVHFTSEDMDVFSKKGLYVITNPASNLKLASGIAPISEFVNRGIPVAIGTDGSASNNCLDMFREMFLVTGLEKNRTGDASCLDAELILQMAVVNGAHAMGLEDCDILASGKQADIIMINLKQPNMQPIHNIAKNLVYSGSKSNIAMTMIAGKILYYDGTFYVGESPEAIYEKCEKKCKIIFEEN